MRLVTIFILIDFPRHYNCFQRHLQDSPSAMINLDERGTGHNDGPPVRAVSLVKASPGDENLPCCGVLR